MSIGQVDVGERDEPVVDDEAAFEHPVVQEVHLEELRDGRARPRRPPLGLEEAALPLARQQRVAVVQGQQELDPVLHATWRA